MSGKSRTISLAGRLREAREASGLSQGQVARKLDFHRPTITEIEAGRRKVSAEELDQFSNLYDVAIDWLVNGTVGEDLADARLLMAARELGKMKDADLDRLLGMLQMLRKARR